MNIFLGKMKNVYGFYRHYIPSKQCLRWCCICQTTKACFHSPLHSEETWEVSCRSTGLRCAICFIGCMDLGYTSSYLSTEKQDDPRNPSKVTLSSSISSMSLCVKVCAVSGWKKENMDMFCCLKREDLWSEITSWEKPVSWLSSVVGKS